MCLSGVQNFPNVLIIMRQAIENMKTEILLDIGFF